MSDEREHSGVVQEPIVYPAPEPEPAPAPPEPQPAAPPHAAHAHAAPLDEALPPIGERDYFSADPQAQEAISRRIDLYFNTPLDIFPFAETGKKPDRFHVMFKRQIDERFPDEKEIRERVSRYGRWMFRMLCFYALGKRSLQAGALIGLWLLAVEGPAWAAGLTPDPVGRAAIAGLGMLLLAGVFFAINGLAFFQYRVTLENRSYVLSREIVQHTRELQNLYTTVRAMPDQIETHYQQDGAGWGRRSAFLIRLLMWIASRMEYLEKYIQVSMWRVRRERYWMNWGGRFVASAIALGWAAWFAASPPPADADALFRALQGVALVIGAALSVASYFLWKTPVNLVNEKLGSDSWIRYATLDLDNTVGEQVRRDKERLVEYRHLTRGR